MKDLRSKRIFQLVLFTLFTLFMVRLWMAYAIPLTDTTEARYAEMTRKMVELSNWITPMFDYGVPFWGKPPLSFWISSLGMELFGNSELAVRTGIFSSSLFFIFFFYRWMKSLNLGRISLPVLVMLCSSFLFFVSTAVVMTDMILMISVCISLMGFWRRLSGGTFNDEIVFYVACGLGLLAKGPIAVIFIFFPVFSWLWLTHQYKVAVKLFSWGKGLFIILGVSLPWYIIAEIKTPGFLDYFIVNEHIKRFLIGGFVGDLYGNPHSKPLGSIWMFWLAALFPWSLFSIVVGVFARKRILNNYQNHKIFVKFLVLWILGPLLLFTFAHNTIWTYPLPSVPPSILLIGVLLQPNEEHKNQKQLLWISVIGLSMSILYLLFSFQIAQSDSKTIKKSQKNLVLTMQKICPQTNCQLLYWQKRFYSADYYSKGSAKVIHNKKDMDSYLKDNKKVFLAVNKKSWTKVPKSVRGNLKLLNQFGEMQLYQYIPIIIQDTGFQHLE